MSGVRIPPAALTPIFGDTVARIRRTSSRVTPPGANPVEVLTEIRTSLFGEPAAADLLLLS